MLNSVFFLLLSLFFLQLNSVLCSYVECSTVTVDEDILSYCKNESTCYIKNVDNFEYSSITCVCKKYKDDYFFAGPDCSIKNNEVLNTSWIEDLFKINTWKNEENRVGKICINPQCK